ncbi:hypothetical protein TrVE_jg7387 [Triparma verrucosa]|uniref:Uncharacterized protein n=1 Tax=Triparma verrucosa TaxID=1606542 RepID=A0A9W7CPC8_9STRA|nr:hypothetical protein TrVE_jg7387 [Triparma verrucosa]
MREMSERNPVFEELLVLTSFRLANDARWDAAGRLILGALLSIFDTVTDIYMIYLYYSTGEPGFANASLISLLMNIAIQLVLVFFQNMRQSKWRMFQEMMYVLTFTKPGIDVYRVVIGAEAEVGAMMNPKSEMGYAKGSELFTEAIPGTIIETYAFLTGSNQSGGAVFSLVMSVFTAAFTSTGISFDKDLDKYSRATAPDFYGYVPDGTKKKVKIFVAMFLMSACHLTAKALACILCAIESTSTVVIYLVIDLAIYFAYKLLRRDIFWWVPIYGMAGLTVALLVRLVVKTIVDFTGNIQLRHPYEHGGAYWAFTILSTPVICFYFGSRYLAFMDNEAEKADELSMVLNSTQVYGMIGGLLVLQVTAFAFFLRTINPEFIHTFYSTTTGNDNTMGYFLNHEDDEHKMIIFDENKHKWVRIKEDVVKWVNEKIPEWNEAQPEWWDARRKAAIPDWAVRDKELLKSIRSGEVIKNKEENPSITLSSTQH